MDKPTEAHRLRIKQELKAAGMTRYGLLKMDSRYLFNLIHEDEHIHGVIYGRMEHLSVMLIATERRLIYINRSPFFTTTDELTYEIVPGIQHNEFGLLNSVTVHTRVGDYALRYVNPTCARKFVAYLEKRRIEGKMTSEQKATKTEADTTELILQGLTKDAQAIDFLQKHDTAVLSTVDRTGNVQGAVVHYVVDIKDRLYVVTKSETAKARAAFVHSQVALTIHEAGTVKTLQIEGNVAVEQNLEMRNMVFDSIIKLRSYKEGLLLPPVTKISKGSFVVLRITPSRIQFSDYSK